MVSRSTAAVYGFNMFWIPCKGIENCRKVTTGTTYFPRMIHTWWWTNYCKIMRGTLALVCLFPSFRIQITFCQKISILSQQKGLKFPEGWVVLQKIPGKVWIFSGTTQIVIAAKIPCAPLKVPAWSRLPYV